MGILAALPAIIGAGSSAAGGIMGILGQRSAKKANEKRLAQILQLLQNQGQAARADVARQGVNERGDIDQSLVNRGLYNSTTRESLHGGSYDRENRANTAISESVANRQAGVLENVTETGPDMRQAYAGLSQLGQYIGNALAPTPQAAPAPTAAGVASKAAYAAGGPIAGATAALAAPMAKQAAMAGYAQPKPPNSLVNAATSVVRPWMKNKPKPKQQGGLQLNRTDAYAAYGKPSFGQ